MKNIKKFLTVLLLIFSLSSHSQLEKKDYANCQEKTFRLNKIISLTSKNGDYNSAIKYLEKDASSDDFEYYLSKSLFDYTLYGKRNAYGYLDEKLEGNEITEEEFYQAKVWLALMTDNIIEYKILIKQFKARFPTSTFLLKMKIKRYLMGNRSSYFRSAKRDQELFQPIDSLFALNNLNSFDFVFFSLAKLDIMKNTLDDKKNNKLKRELKKLEKNYPNEIWKPYLMFELGEDNFLRRSYGLENVSTKPTKEERENWTKFYDFLNNNPFFDETKISTNYDGFPIFYYPRINNEDELYEALNTMDRLIKKYPGIISLKETKLLIVEIFKDMFSNKSEMSKYYFSTLFDLFEFNGDSGFDASYIVPKFVYDEESLIELLSNLEKTDFAIIKEQFELSLKNEPEHLNLLEISKILEKFESKRN